MQESTTFLIDYAIYQKIFCTNKQNKHPTVKEANRLGKVLFRVHNTTKNTRPLLNTYYIIPASETLQAFSLQSFPESVLLPFDLIVLLKLQPVKKST